MHNASVNANTSGRDGGGILSRGLQTLTNTDISGNTAGGLGGGLAITAVETQLSNGTIKSNSAATGGGVAVVQDGLASLHNVTIADGHTGLASS